MSLYFTADTHFGHRNIIRYCHRPFRSPEEMENMIVANWKRTVRENDEIYHLGDVFFSRSTETTEKYCRLISILPGKKYLVPGNHDVGQNHLDALSHVFTVLPQLHEITVRGNSQSIRLILCHYPLRTWNGIFRGSINLFGHVHGRIPADSQSCDIGCDVWGFTPVSLETIVEYLKNCPPCEYPDRPQEDSKS